MSNSIYVSYSSASRYKTCPKKYYLSKDYKTKKIPSALAFGKAVESGVVVMLLGGTLEEAQAEFRKHWENEDMGGGKTRPIFDNLEVEFYNSDYDKNLLFGSSDEQVNTWYNEIFGESDAHWMPHFDAIGERMREGKATNDEVMFYNRVIWLCCLVRGEVMLQAFHDDILPNVEVMSIDGKPAIQRAIEIENEEGDKVTGFIDFILLHKDYKEPIVTDLKTAAYPYGMHQLDTSEQLRTYIAAVGAELETARGGYLVLLKKIKVDKSCDRCGAQREGLAKKCKACGKGEYTIPKLRGEVQFITKRYSDEELEDVLEDYMNVTVAIKNQVTFKNASNCTQYGRQCEFYDHCWGRKKLEELSHLEPKKVLTEENKEDIVE